MDEFYHSWPNEVSSSQDNGFTGILLVGENARKDFFVIQCPCGVQKKFALNQLPEVDTPMGCGNTSHFAVRYLP